MTVAELIAELQKMPQDADVIFDPRYEPATTAIHLFHVEQLTLDETSCALWHYDALRYNVPVTVVTLW